MPIRLDLITTGCLSKYTYMKLLTLPGASEGLGFRRNIIFFHRRISIDFQLPTDVLTIVYLTPPDDQSFYLEIR